MRLRIRLILAFLLLSVVPLGAVTVYSYISNTEALQVAATREADHLATELSQRMQLVTAQLSQRVEHLMDIPQQPVTVVRTSSTHVVPTAPTAPPAPDAPAAPVVAEPSGLDTQVADALGEAAMLLNTVEVRGLRPPGGGRGRGGPGGPGGGPGGQGGQGRGAPGGGGFPGNPDGQRRGGGGPGGPGRFPPNAQRGQSADATTVPGPAVSPASPTTIPTGAISAPVPPITATVVMMPGPPPEFSRGRKGDETFVGPRPPRPDNPPAPPSSAPPPRVLPGVPVPDLSGADAADRIQIDLGPIARDMFRQIMPEGTQMNDMTPEQRQRLASEVNQRMLGIVEGIKLGAAELQKKAEEARRKADADKNATAKQKAAALAAAPVKRRSALTGNRLDVTLEQNGRVVRAVNAEINLPNVLMTVFSTMPRGQGEVPFALGKDGRIYTPSDKDRAKVEPLGPMKLKNGATMVDDWIVVTTNDPTGSGLRLGIARPVGDSLTEIRRTAGRNAALGLLFIGLAIVGIVPLSGGLTRNLSTLTEGVTRIAHGDYGARVPLKSKDEIGELASAFNLMAAQVEQHQHDIVEQERLKRELELGRQIQNEMLPSAPLTMGLTQIEGVSVPAREVGGDFFNYFALPNGDVALLVGDVSGKGVGAALLMANIQASLRTRLSLGQDLSAITDAIDRDIAANSPGQMYATMFLGILDTKSRVLRYVNAGHNPQFALGAKGTLERLSATGLPIGLLSGRGYLERTVQLMAGDLIVFYTDGVVETENEQEDMFGAERFEGLLSSLAGRTSAEVLRDVEKELKAYRGTREPYDDATLMAVSVG